MKPVCKNCGDSGKGAEFSLSSEHGFGTFCVKCEGLVSARALRIIARLKPQTGAFDGKSVDIGEALQREARKRNGGKVDMDAARKALDEWHRGGE